MNQENATLQSADPKPPTRDKIRLFWFTVDIILILFLILSLAPILYFGPLISYYSMLHWGDQRLPFYLAFIMALALFPACFLAFIGLMVRIFVFWPRQIASEKVRVTMQVLTFCGLIAFIVFPFVFGRPPQKSFIDGFKERIEDKPDVPAIRQWLATLDKEHCTGERIDVLWSDPNRPNWPDFVDWPDYITEFRPDFICLDKDENENPILKLIWDGFQSHWGLAVGHETLEPPEPTKLNYDFVALELSEGVYVWYDY